MASEKDQLIKAQRLINLKQDIKNLCLKRKWVGSVESFGSSSWDFDPVPTNDNVISTDQYSKISIPVKKINWKKVPNGPVDRVVNDVDLTNFEVAVAAFDSRSIEDTSATDCNSLCTGTCTTTCTTGCSNGCSGGCQGCGGSCSNNCSSSCYGGCKSGCSTTCGNDCTTGCGTGCAGDCISKCADTSSCDSGAVCSSDCSGTCKYGCTSGCSTNCHGGCSTECGASADAANCGNNCKYF